MNPMTGMTQAGTQVESPRRKTTSRYVAHPLTAASPAESRAMTIRAFKAAGKTMAEISVIMRCSVRTLQNDLAVPSLSIA
jgi:DNA-binding CsgD family transcriptional regulator